MVAHRLALAEMQVERSKVVMESLAGFCHALGQPATVLLSSIELLKMPSTDPELQKQVLYRSADYYDAGPLGFGFSDETAWQNMSELLQDMDMISGKESVSSAFTNEFIPAE